MRRPSSPEEVFQLRDQIEELRSALTAIRAGGVDAVIMRTDSGEQVYTLENADRPYRLIVEEMGEGAATISERGTILHVNPRLAHMLGRERCTLLGSGVDTLLPADQQESANRLLQGPPGTTRRTHLDLAHADGSRVPVLASVTGLSLDDVLVRCLIATDLTEYRRAERRILAANAALTKKARELEDAQRVAHVGSWFWDPGTDHVTMSTQTALILMRDPAGGPATFAEVFAALAHPDDRGLLPVRDRALARRDRFEYPYRILLPGGTTRHVLVRGEVLLDENGAASGVHGTIQDVTTLKEVQLALDQTTAQFAAAFEHTPVGMALVDPDYVIQHANRALAVMLQVPMAGLRGRSLPEFLRTPGEEDGPAPLAEHGSGTGPTDRATEWRLRTASGRSGWVSLRIALLGQTASRGYAVAHVEDITDRKAHEAQLSYLANHDHLTGLLNRRAFRALLEHHAAVTSCGGGAVVLLDLDNFKYINDSLGHPTGDLLLGALARAMRQRLGDGDVMARLGGDEFAVLLSGVDAERARAATENLLAAVRGTALDPPNGAAHSTASAGVVLLGVPSTTVDEVLADADLAMYAAKRAGGDRLSVFDPAGPVAEESRATLLCLDRVRTALERDRFTLVAQPILHLPSDRILSCELLLRLQDDQGLTPPNEFLDIAQSHGMAQAIDRFVVRRAIRTAARSRVPPGFRWEVNLSVDALNDASLPDLIRVELARHGVCPHALIFEITETTAISNMEQAQAFAAIVGRLGCSFAIDDFGRGYGSFYYLKHLPLDYLKIDGEFIHNITTSHPDQVIVRSIIETARALGLRTIAEYVHDQETLDLLRAFRVDYAQGFHIGRPVDPDSLTTQDESLADRT